MNGSRQRDRRASAARKWLCEDLFQAILPPPDGSLLPRAFNFVALAADVSPLEFKVRRASIGN